MDFLKVDDAIKDISPFVGLDPVNDQDKLFLYLSMAQSRAWKAGSYKGFMREATLKTYDFGGRHFLMTPHGYNVLMGININSKPTKMFESYFSWHHNGLGSITSECRLKYADCTLEYRESPTLYSHDLLQAKEFKLAVLARHAQDTGQEVTVTGLDVNGRPVTASLPTQASVAAGVSDLDIVYGARIKLEANKLMLLDDVNWMSIEALSKGVTHGDVDFYMVRGEGASACVDHIATIGPFQSKSLYRIYEVPASMCKHHKLECLLKIGEPEKIRSASQFLMIDDIEALMSLVMSVHETFDKKDLALGNGFMTLGVANLEAEHKSSRSPTLQPIQILGMDEEINFQHDYSL
jgi:hypothetical protein